MARAATSLPVLTDRRGFGRTMRPDAWWLQPVAVFLGLSAFIVYSTWAAFQGQHYAYGNYLSPFYSPELFGDTHHAWLGPKPSWWLSWLPWSPAFLILWAPGGFRLTCYYYRGAYYKAFWADPPSCAVGEPRKGYRGERSFPLILQNVHRYFLYLALVFIVILAYDAWKAMWFEDPATGQTTFGIGIGTLVLTVNVILLGGYTLGCHSLRHLVGGRLNLLSKHPARRKAH
ncbi:MAG: succinate dehydrogenase, partial [Gemmatimonadetes bacterium]|nr:succinate dehydrogenase [Gemmatimonadota bacterium]NIY09298.1 succinate dehydrogenase [Gemmatimonadota bacterium]